MTRKPDPLAESDFQSDWVSYYQAIAGRPPRETLLTALNNFAPEARFAVDLGCGDGRDTVELLRRGWRVLGIDGEAQGITRLLSRPGVDTTNLDTQVVRFEALQLPNNVDLINASFSLPFCPPAEFPALWNKVVTSLRPGGRFCGQLFGNRDSWANYPSLNHHTRAQVEELLQPFVMEMLCEEDHPGKTATGKEKHWHLFHIVACKKVNQ